MCIRPPIDFGGFLLTSSGVSFISITMSNNTIVVYFSFDDLLITTKELEKKAVEEFEKEYPQVEFHLEFKRKEFSGSYALIGKKSGFSINNGDNTFTDVP